MMIQRKRSTGGMRPYSKRQKTAGGYRGRTAVLTYQPRQPLGEWKYKDTLINVAIDATGTQTLLNGISPGNGASERVGMKICIKTVEIILRVKVTDGTGVDQDQRLMILLDRQANGAAPAALTDFLLAANITSPRALTNRKRFKTFWNKIYSLNASGESGSHRIYKAYLKFRRPIIVDYNAGAAGTVADISSNALYLITLGSVVAGATAGVAYGYIRLRYTDM